jgi:hypothetical protein
VESMGRADNGEERGYVVVYSATDASGNRSTAKARVTLPMGKPIPTAPAAVPATPTAAAASLPRLALLP